MSNETTPKTEKLTEENYYSDEANKKYMSVSQFKQFAGTLGKPACEAKAIDQMENKTFETSTSLLVGSYVDAFYEGTLDNFKNCHPEIISSKGPTKGQLKADYKQADSIINRTQQDKLFQEYMSGQKQVIMTGNLFGVDWKIKMDSYFPDDKIVDLKIVESIRKTFWVPGMENRMDFIRYWGYDIQGAIYQKIVELNTKKRLPFYIAATSKEKTTDIEVIEITQPYLDAALEFVKMRLPHVLAVKNKTTPPQRCGTCSYCLNTKILTAPISLDVLSGENTQMSSEFDNYAFLSNSDAMPNPFAD